MPAAMTPGIRMNAATTPKAKELKSFGGGVSGLGGGQVGGIFKQFSQSSGAPNAPIKPVKVDLPNRGDFGGPAATPTITPPSRSDFGTPDRAGIDEAAKAGRDALKGFNDPTSTGAFQRLMGLAGEQTAAQAGEQSRHAADAAQRRGYGGGFESTARSAAADRMSALATAGFAGAQSIQQAEGEQYGRAIGAFTELQKSYNEALSTGDVAFAHDLTTTRIQQAQAQLSTLDLNQRQQLAYADALNQAKQLQATLNEQFNKDLIDNNRFIQGQAQVAAQLAAQMATLQEHKREFDISDAERKREFDLGLKANPGTALRTFEDPRFGGGKNVRSGAPGLPGNTFKSMMA